MDKKTKSVRIVYVHVRRISLSWINILNGSHTCFTPEASIKSHTYEKQGGFFKIVQLRTESYSIIMLNLANISLSFQDVNRNMIKGE